MTWVWKLLPLCLWLCSFLTECKAIKLGVQGGLRNEKRERKPTVRVQGMEILGRDWSATDYGEVVTFFDVRYAPGACPNCTQPRFSYSDSSRWREGLSSPILANGPNPRKMCSQPYLPFNDPSTPLDAEISEDCLYLDIYAPRKAIIGKKRRSKRDVLVFIHGGGGFTGDKNGVGFFTYAGEGYKGLPEEKRPIVISINYRLTFFSTLRHPDLEPAQWNLHILDCIEALKWIQKNIGRFGGDKSKVTIMGQSYGGNIVGHLTRATSARGLFRRAIPISGFSLAEYSVSPTDESATDGVAEWFNENLGGKSIFNVSADELARLDFAGVMPMSQQARGGNNSKFGIFWDEDVHPPYTGWDAGRDDHKDVPLLIMGNDLEFYLGPLGQTVPAGENLTIDGARSWSDSGFQGLPRYLWCLRSRIEELELENGADEYEALFRAHGAALPAIGQFPGLLARRQNVFTATFTDHAYGVCDTDVHNPFAMNIPNHGSEMMGVAMDISPWIKILNKTPQELKSELASGLPTPIPCETLKSQKQALEVGFVNATVHDMVRKAIIDFTVHGTPGWENEQHASFEPTSNGQPKLAPALGNEVIYLTEAFLTKCASECKLVTDQGPTTVMPSEDVCKPIIQNIECVC